jgi:hypothetical protein
MPIPTSNTKLLLLQEKVQEAKGKNKKLRIFRHKIDTNDIIV